MVFLERIPKHATLTAEQEQDLARRIEQGDQDAINTLVLNNRLLAVSVVMKYFRVQADEMDFVAEAHLALCSAARRFRVGMARFSTFACTCIYRHLLSHTASAKSIVVYPRSSYWVGVKAASLIANSGNKMTLEQAAEIIEPGCVETLAMVKRHAMVPKRTSMADPHAVMASSDKGLNSPTAMAIEKEKTEAVQTAIASLPKRLRSIVKRRIWKEHTLQAIADDIGVSKERVRQLERRAFDKLRELLLEQR